MNELQHVKYFPVTQPAAITDAASFATATIDTIGFDFLTIIFMLGETDIAMTVLKVQESDASNMASAADIVGTRIGTDADFVGTTTVLPSATDDNKLVVFQLNLQGRKRYLDLVATIGDGSAGGFAAAVAILSRAESSPTTEAEAGTLWLMRK